MPTTSVQTANEFYIVYMGLLLSISCTKLISLMIQRQIYRP